MPNVTPYTGLAMGNGFPFCLESVNVADKGDGTPYDYWTTLGGYNKEDADADIAVTPEQISLSLQNAWRLYWMLNGMVASVDEGLGPYDSIIDLFNDEYPDLSSDGDEQRTVTWYKLNGETEDDTNKTPAERVCYYGFRASYQNLEDGTFSPPIHTLQVLDRIYDGEDFVSVSLIIRMYDGPTDNEDNFVGYGIGYVKETDGEGRFIFNNDTAFAKFTQSILDFGLCSASVDPPVRDPDDSSDVAYVEIGGFPFVAYAFATNVDSPTTTTISNDNDTVSVDYNLDSSQETDYNITIDSLDFYSQ